MKGGDPGRGGRDWPALLLTGWARFSLAVSLALLAGILVWVVVRGGGSLSLEYFLGSPREGGILPMLVGSGLRVFLMALMVVPFGVVLAIGLFEYGHEAPRLTAMIGNCVRALSGVPPLVVGLFGLAFFVHVVGGGLDRILGSGEPVWENPALIWASLTMAVTTLPLVVLSTGERLQARAGDLRRAALALGATRTQALMRILLPRALPGILAGSLLAVGRAGASVVPILFTGVIDTMDHYPQRLTDRFMDLGYHVYRESEAPGESLPAALLVLLLFTLTLNLFALLLRSSGGRESPEIR